MLKRKVVVDQSGITAGQLQDFWRKVGDGTIDGRVFGRMLDNAVQIRKEVMKGDFVTLVRARDVMGQNFFGPGDADHFFGCHLGLSPATFVTVPFSEEFLRSHSDDFVLVAMPSVSVVDVVELMKEQSIPVLAEQGKANPWFAEEGFAHVKVDAGWHLVVKDVEASQEHPGTAYELDPAAPFRQSSVRSAVLLYTAVAYFLATGKGQRLFTNGLVGSGDLSSQTNRFAIQFLTEGLKITDIYEDDCD